MSKDRTPPQVEMRPGGPRPGPRVTEKPKNAKKTLLRLASYIGKSKKTLVALLSVMLIATLCTLVSPMLQGSAIDAIEPLRVAEWQGEEIIRYTDGDTVLWLASDGSAVSGVPDGIDTSLRLTVHFFREEYVGRSGETLGLVFYLTVMGIAAAMAALFSFFQQRLAAKLSQYTVYSMRNDLFGS